MIRQALLKDAATIAAIYSWYVVNTTVTYEITVPTAQEMSRRLESITRSYPYLVYEEEGCVVGYAYAASFHQREAFYPTVEVSVYFAQRYCGGGRGEKLLSALWAHLAKDLRLQTVIAVIDADNIGSRRFFESQGFLHRGTLTKVGYKLEKWLGLSYYEKQLRV